MAHPPAFDPKWTMASAFMSPQRADVSQEWLTPAGALRRDLEVGHNVAQFEAGAMKFAQGQIQTLLQTMFFMWMIGTQLSLFSMIFLVQGGFTPFLSVLRVNQGALIGGEREGVLCTRAGRGTGSAHARARIRVSLLAAPSRHSRAHPAPPPPTQPAAFAPFALPGVNTFTAKGIYIAIHAVGCFFIAWKLKALGILPITSADWVSLIPAKRFLDHSS